VENNTTTPAEENSATWKECDEDTRQNILSLGDDDFPLVCTFNRFLRLLENSIKYIFLPYVFPSEEFFSNYFKPGTEPVRETYQSTHNLSTLMSSEFTIGSASRLH